MSEFKKNKKRLVSNTLDPDLHDWFKGHAASIRKSVSGLLNEHIFQLSCSLNSKKED